MRLILIGILFIVVVAVFITVQNKEHFASSQTGPANQSVLDTFGIQKCKALYTEDPALQGHELNVMNTFVNGLRVKEWKWDPQDPASLSNNAVEGKSYCYLYNDATKNVQDTILRKSECSTQNPAFNNPMISRVFSTTFQDNVHNVPVEKCVLEIDNNAAHDVQNMQTLWRTWGDTDCENMDTDLRAELQKIRSSNTYINATYNTALDNMTDLQAANRTTKHELKQCNASNNTLFANHTDLVASYNLSTCNVVAEWLSYGQTSSNLEYTQGVIKTLDTDIGGQDSLYKKFQRLNGSCVKDKGTCAQHTSVAKNNAHVLQSDNAYLATELINLQGSIDQWTGSWTQLQNDNSNCTNDLRNKQQLYKYIFDSNANYIQQNITCQTEKNDYQSKYLGMLSNYEYSSNAHAKCQDDVQGYMKDLEACTTPLSTCLNDTDIVINFNPTVMCDASHVVPKLQSIRDDITNLERERDAYQNNYKSCIEENRVLKTTIDTLETRKTIMSGYLGDLLKQSKTNQSESYKQQMNSFSEFTKESLVSQLEATRAHTEKLLEQSCSDTQVELDASIQSAIDINQQLRGELDIKGRNIEVCKPDCKVTLAQCLIHAQNDVICKKTKPSAPLFITLYSDSGNKEIKTEGIHDLFPDNWWSSITGIYVPKGKSVRVYQYNFKNEKRYPGITQVLAHGFHDLPYGLKRHTMMLQTSPGNVIAPPPGVSTSSARWVLKLWQDDKYKKKMYQISSEDVGKDGMYKTDYGWFLPHNPFGTSSYTLDQIQGNTRVEFWAGTMTHSGKGEYAMGNVKVQNYKIIDEDVEAAKLLAQRKDKELEDYSKGIYEYN